MIQKPLLMRSSLIVLIMLTCLSGNAAADSLSSIMGWPYDIDKAPGLSYSDVLEVDQQWIIYPRLAEIVYPVLGMPGIVEPEGELIVFVWADPAQALMQPDGWIVTITTGAYDDLDQGQWVGDPIPQTYPVKIENIEYHDKGNIYELHGRISSGAPPDGYHLEVTTIYFSDIQFNAVSVTRSIEPDLQFAHITDTHMGDPRGVSGGRWLNSGDFPGYTDDTKKLVENIVLQQVTELNLLKPAFVLLSGDLAYGLDYIAEYQECYDLLKNAQVPIFMVPGNHDGMASKIKSDDWQYDGLNYFHQTIGPSYFSFDYGPLHIVGLNTYDGSRERRESYPLKPIASPVDNYGGQLSQAQFEWLMNDLVINNVPGRQSIIFGHHDPRGPFSANTPFPSHPLGILHDEWNYDSDKWDSDPSDDIHDESPLFNTGIMALNLFVENGVSHIFLGHVHSDWVDFTDAETEIRDFEGSGTGVVSQGPMRWVHTTTAGSDVGSKVDYWGYRLIDVEGGILRDVDYSIDPQFGSIPAGNFWTRDLIPNDGTNEHVEILVNNSLFEPVTVNLEFFMPASATGYRIYDLETEEELSIRDVGLGDGSQTVLYTRMKVPAGSTPTGFPPPAWEGELRTIVAVPDYDNNPPQAVITIEEIDEENGTIVLSALDSTDPDVEDSIVRYDWSESNRRYAGGRLIYNALEPGLFTFHLTVMDNHGGQSSTSAQIRLKRVDDDDDDSGCGCNIGGSGSVIPAIFVIFALAFLRYRHWRA